MESVPVDKPAPTDEKPQHLCQDKGYDRHKEVEDLAAEFGFTAHIRRIGEESRKLQRTARRRARRWVVERTHSWMNRFRGVLIRWSKKSANYLAMLHLVCAVITYRCNGLFG